MRVRVSPGMLCKVAVRIRTYMAVKILYMRAHKYTGGWRLLKCNGPILREMHRKNNMHPTYILLPKCNWIAHFASNEKAAGSSPAGSVFDFVAQPAE